MGETVGTENSDLAHWQARRGTDAKLAARARLGAGSKPSSFPFRAATRWLSLFIDRLFYLEK